MYTFIHLWKKSFIVTITGVKTLSVTSSLIKSRIENIKIWCFVEMYDWFPGYKANDQPYENTKFTPQTVLCINLAFQTVQPCSLLRPRKFLCFCLKGNKSTVTMIWWKDSQIRDSSEWQTTTMKNKDSEAPSILYWAFFRFFLWLYNDWRVQMHRGKRLD